MRILGHSGRFLDDLPAKDGEEALEGRDDDPGTFSGAKFVSGLIQGIEHGLRAMKGNDLAGLFENAGQEGIIALHNSLREPFRESYGQDHESDPKEKPERRFWVFHGLSR